MAEKRSTKSPYESRFGGGWLSPAQYLAESMCDRQARKEGRVLGRKFWNGGEWKHTFLTQVRHALSLLKLYTVEAVIKALRSPEGKKVYSLGAPWLDPLIAKEQQALIRQKEAREAEPLQEAPPENALNEKPREAFSHKQSPLTRLRNLDG